MRIWTGKRDHPLPAQDAGGGAREGRTGTSASAGKFVKSDERRWLLVWLMFENHVALIALLLRAHIAYNEALRICGK